MNKINLISDIIKISLKFDDVLKKGKFCELKKYSDELNNKLEILEKSGISDLDIEILSTIDKIKQINIYAINHVSKLLEKYNHKKSNNTLIFFYSNKCVYSRNFFPEWKNLKKTLKDKVNMIAIDCKKEDRQDICNFFNIHEYPTIKYITPTKIHDYHGNMTHDEILNTFLLN